MTRKKEKNQTRSVTRKSAAESSRQKTESLPVIPLKKAVVFPYTINSFLIEEQAIIDLVDNLVEDSRMAVFMPLRDGRDGTGGKKDFHEIGAVGRIVKRLRLPDGGRRILIRGLRRVRIERMISKTQGSRALVRDIMVPEDDSMETEALARNIFTLVQNLLELAPGMPEELNVALYNIEDYGRLADFVADTMNFSYPDKLQVLSQVELAPRLNTVVNLLSREVMVLKIGGEIQDKVNTSLSKSQREHVLREQLRAIQEQLNEPEDTPETQELRSRIEKAVLSGKARQAAQRELERLRQMHPHAPEHNVTRNYIEWILALPWREWSKDQLNLAKATRQLDRDHFDLTQAKERIIEFLAVMQLRGDLGRAPILCFVGPPGVGKTSLGQSIANTLHRRFVRLSLGGVRDEAELRGHRRTYIGSMPGRIVQGLRDAGTANPVFMLDEIDKLGRDFRGDPAAALLEILDPAQNTAFSDHYLEIPFDLSQVLFVTTANVVDTIPPALQDRMEVIRLPGYTQEEKIEIARKFIIPRQSRENGLEAGQVSFHKHALQRIISEYTREAGVRNLERTIAKICRKQARRLVENGGTQSKWKLTDKKVPDFLGPSQVYNEKIQPRPQVGMVNGLAWTQAGGEVLKVEAGLADGKGKLTLTGSLGEVMKESAQIALSYVKSQASELKIAQNKFAESDVHIHVPAGATPKDGPSAGLAMAAALASLFTGRAVSQAIAMTGELSLRGQVRPVGGIKEKILAAHRLGLRTVLLPDEMQEQAKEEIPETVKSKLTIHFVKTANEAFEHILQVK